MPRKVPEIRTESYCYVGGKLTNTKDLPPELKRRLADQIRIGLIEGAYPGVRVYVEEETERGKQHGDDQRGDHPGLSAGGR